MSNLIDRMPWARKEAYVSTEPYPYGWVDGFLPADLYDRLSASFVSPDQNKNSDTLGRGKKRVLFTTPPMPTHLEEMPEDWIGFLDALSDRNTMAQAFDWARSLTPAETAEPGYQELFALRNALSVDDLYWQCEFSSMDANVLLPPHSDSTDKILIFVHYFAPDGWQAEWGGETEVYSAKNPAQNRNWSNFFLNHAQVETLAKCRFLPNRLFYFVKTQAAWHGVSPLSAATSLPRRSFNFSLRIKPDAKVPARLTEVMAEIKARESGVFAPR